MEFLRPVILDTDIGDDIDDSWALTYLLNCPELKTLMINTVSGDLEYKAKICAKMLSAADREDIPIGYGIGSSIDERMSLLKWIRDFDLKKYQGKVYQDGISSMIDLIKASPSPVTIIAIGPLTNIAEFIRRAPELVSRTSIVAMAGSISKKHNFIDGTIAEFNILQDIAAAQKVFSAPWHKFTLTPLDSCGGVVLDGNDYLKVKRSKSSLNLELMNSYKHFIKTRPEAKFDFDTSSSILYDTVAVHLAYSDKELVTEQLPLLVDNDGFTKIDPLGNIIDVAIGWNDLDSYKKNFVNRLVQNEFDMMPL